MRIMARVRQNESWAIGRLLDLGALGIVVPMVNTAEGGPGSGLGSPLSAQRRALLGAGRGGIPRRRLRELDRR